MLSILKNVSLNLVKKKIASNQIRDQKVQFPAELMHKIHNIWVMYLVAVPEVYKDLLRSECNYYKVYTNLLLSDSASSRGAALTSLLHQHSC